MVILERPMPGREITLSPGRKNSTIASLEGQIHARRLEIKGLSSNLHMLGVLNANGLADSDFPTERSSIVNRMLDLNRQQHIDRKQLRPHKRAKETKGKSPFNQAVNRSYPTESASGLKTLPLETKAEAVVLFEKKRGSQKDPLTNEITQIMQQLTDLGTQKREQKLTPEEYRQLSKPLGRKLNQLQDQVKQNRIREYLGNGQQKLHASYTR